MARKYLHDILKEATARGEISNDEAAAVLGAVLYLDLNENNQGYNARLGRYFSSKLQQIRDEEEERAHRSLTGS